MSIDELRHKMDVARNEADRCGRAVSCFYLGRRESDCFTDFGHGSSFPYYGNERLYGGARVIEVFARTHFGYATEERKPIHAQR